MLLTDMADTRRGTNARTPWWRNSSKRVRSKVWTRRASSKPIAQHLLPDRKAEKEKRSGGVGNIFHWSFTICHCFIAEAFVAAKIHSFVWSMANDKWKIFPLLFSFSPLLFLWVCRVPLSRDYSSAYFFFACAWGNTGVLGSQSH